jgi:hypothetical protein
MASSGVITLGGTWSNSNVYVDGAIKLTGDTTYAHTVTVATDKQSATVSGEAEVANKLKISSDVLCDQSVDLKV